MEQDYKKLERINSYLKETVHLSFVIGADNNETLIWSIDSSFAVHSVCTSHTGACLTIGYWILLPLL